MINSASDKDGKSVGAQKGEFISLPPGNRASFRGKVDILWSQWLSGKLIRAKKSGKEI